MTSESQYVRQYLYRFADGWQGVVLVATTYIYFLIFAQFGFLKRLAEFGIAGDALKPIMGAMALGGIAASLLCPLIHLIQCPRCRLQGAFLGCAVAAELTLFSITPLSAILIALLIGLSLGLLTTTLVAHLPRWTGSHHQLLKVGLGTGLGYLVCNFPPLFNASPVWIAYASIAAAFLGAACGFRNHTESVSEQKPLLIFKQIPFGLALFWFTALVWLDSAAFFIIQNSPALKAGTWQGDLHLWRTGALHLAAALFAAWLLLRRGVATTLTFALVALGSACLLLQNPTHLSLASLFYPIGVSLYSVALVAFPSILMQARSQSQRERRSGYLYALAGWVGSALGIGMAQNLHFVPSAFLFAAALLFAVPWLLNQASAIRLQGFAVLLVLLLAIGFNQLIDHSDQSYASLSAADRGRRIYINEGCINCHSQYVRPNSPDEQMWGPASIFKQVQAQQPPLIGNRRQGPDLSDVGTRRSAQWLRIHFLNPREISYNSPMPGYSYLFTDGRGNDLITYMQSLSSPAAVAQLKSLEANWLPVSNDSLPDTKADGKTLFEHLCATCHDAGGEVRFYGGLNKLPPDLSTTAWSHVPNNASRQQVELQLMRIIKYGVPETNMAGHEYLNDAQLRALADYVLSRRSSSILH